jgi:hypothetical protein
LFTVGYGLSHSLTCNFVSKTTFEFILNRSLFNDDKKGEDELVHLDVTESVVELRINFNTLLRVEDSSMFYKSYN